MNRELKVKCCHCKKEFSYYSSKYRPFCTERCKMVDLGHWFEESYSVEGRDNSVYIEDSGMLDNLIDETNETY